MRCRHPAVDPAHCRGRTRLDADRRSPGHSDRTATRRGVTGLDRRRARRNTGSVGGVEADQTIGDHETDDFAWRIRRPLPPVIGPGAGHGPRWLDELSCRSDLPDLVRHAPACARPPRAVPDRVGDHRADPAYAAGRRDQRRRCCRREPGWSPRSAAETGSSRCARTSTRCRCRGDRTAVRLHRARRLPRLRPRHAHHGAARAAALALARAGGLAGRVRLIFQPAEEVMPGGSHDVIAAGALNGRRADLRAALRPAAAGRPGRPASRPDHLDHRPDRAAAHRPGGHTSRPHLTADLVYALGMVITGLPVLLSRGGSTRGPRRCWSGARCGPVRRPTRFRGTGVLRGTLRHDGPRGPGTPAEPLVTRAGRRAAGADGVSYELELPCAACLRSTTSRSAPTLHADRRRRRAGAAAAVAAEQSTGAEDFAVFLDHVPGRWPGWGSGTGSASGWTCIRRGSGPTTCVRRRRRVFVHTAWAPWRHRGRRPAGARCAAAALGSPLSNRQPALARCAERAWSRAALLGMRESVAIQLPMERHGRWRSSWTYSVGASAASAASAMTPR